MPRVASGWKGDVNSIVTIESVLYKCACSDCRLRASAEVKFRQNMISEYTGCYHVICSAAICCTNIQWK